MFRSYVRPWKPGAFELGYVELDLLDVSESLRDLCHAERLAGSWRGIYVVGAVMCLYFNLFVLVVQSFEKIPALHALAPTQTESPFKLSQLVVLAVSILLLIAALFRFRPEPATVV